MLHFYTTKNQPTTQAILIKIIYIIMDDFYIEMR